MRKEYDFSKARRNPYAKLFKQQITIRLDKESVAYFKALAEETGIAYQQLINMYLTDCVREARRPVTRWNKAVQQSKHAPARRRLQPRQSTSSRAISGRR